MQSVNNDVLSNSYMPAPVFSTLFMSLYLQSHSVESQSRDITLPTKICIVKAMAFPVVMHACKSWTTKKAGCQRTDAFELWCWRRFLRVPWTARRSNQSILKEIGPGYSLEGLMLKAAILWPPGVKS